MHKVTQSYSLIWEEIKRKVFVDVEIFHNTFQKLRNVGLTNVLKINFMGVIDI